MDILKYILDAVDGCDEDEMHFFVSGTAGRVSAAWEL